MANIGGMSNIDLNSLSDADKRELQTYLESETQKASIQESSFHEAVIAFYSALTITQRHSQSHEHVLQEMCHLNSQLWHARQVRAAVHEQLC